MKQVDLHSLPPCSLSTDCLRLLDDLDERSITQKLEQASFKEDIQDKRLLEHLRLHLPHCPTCRAILAQARHVRSQQRAMLRDFLIENEVAVSSTTSEIFATIRRVQKNAPQPQPGASSRRTIHSLQETTTAHDSHKLNGNNHHDIETLSTSYRHSWLRNGLTLATVAALILFAIGILSYFVNRQVTAGHITAVVDSNGWDSVVIGLTLTAPGVAKLMGIYNYNPTDDKHDDLVSSSQLPADIQLEGVSPDGHNLLYRYSMGGHTRYSTLVSVKGMGFFYELNDGDAGNAIWMDNNHALIATVNNGVVLLNIHTGASTNMFPTLKVEHLMFYHAPYIYFIGKGGPNGSVLDRVKFNDVYGTPQVISMSPTGIGSNYWLSPDGSTIYYTDSLKDGGLSIQSVSSDGTHPGKVLSGAITPVGYAKPVGFAADSSLEALRISSGKFQVIKYASSGQPFQLVLDDAAPGASSLCSPGATTIICDSNIAFAPNGHGLIVNAFYADGSQRVWFDDLTSRTHRLILKLNASMKVQLPGWDRIPVTSG